MGTRQRLYDSHLSRYLELTEEKSEHELFEMYRDHLLSLEGKRELPPHSVDRWYFNKVVYRTTSGWTSIQDVIQEMTHEDKYDKHFIEHQHDFWVWLSPYVNSGSVIRYVTENGEGYGWWFTEGGVYPIRGELRWVDDSNGYGRDITYELPESYILEYPEDLIPRLVKN
jgi:hypothetical protein